MNNELIIRTSRAYMAYKHSESVWNVATIQLVLDLEQSDQERIVIYKSVEEIDG
jgi:hypothetical protein